MVAAGQGFEQASAHLALQSHPWAIMENLVAPV
jgi:hypothetical protein